MDDKATLQLAEKCFGISRTAQRAVSETVTAVTTAGLHINQMLLKSCEKNAFGALLATNCKEAWTVTCLVRAQECSRKPSHKLPPS